MSRPERSVAETVQEIKARLAVHAHADTMLVRALENATTALIVHGHIADAEAAVNALKDVYAVLGEVTE